ncbi:alkaline phosphatase [Glomus cerebriforme]|uniref:Alkaline phosphatase n=1 Tax=Glomus cerebriforme TaxID=658196 RepID=A0A397TJ08_9GLOM|nr:alkaline phosphatase [Glomus cerebriforme]
MANIRLDPEETERLLGFGPERKKTRRELCVVCSAAVAVITVAIGLTAVWVSVSLAYADSGKRNVILMISDGFGPASETFARTYKQYINKLEYNYVSPLDKILVGSSRTRSSDSLVTDSAAGATAFSCAIKTYNSAIGVNPKKVPCGTVLESAKHFGLATGLVVTSRITDATPASFSAHVVHREMESDIAVQQIGDNPLGRQVDLIIGGGRCFFLPNHTEGSCRIDERDLIKESKKREFKFFSTRQEFDDLEPAKDKLPLLGLFTLDHMSYEIDRDPIQEPSLKEMSEKALKFLESATSNSDKGFFLVIEGSRIDMAAHVNDPATHVHEILAYHDTISLVKKYVDEHPGTVMISVSDHETGGLSLARQVSSEYPDYLWYPEPITRVKNSSYILSQALVSYQNKDRKEYIKGIIRDGLGIEDFEDYDISWLNENRTQMEYEIFLANMTSFRAQLGWATHGHSAIDVNLYAHGQNTDILRGNHENTDIGDFIAEYLNLDLDFITNKLNSNNDTFHQVTDSTHFHVDRLSHHHGFISDDN